MNTAAATRRLIEALADVNRTPGVDHGEVASPLLALTIGLRYAAEVQSEGGTPEQLMMARINGAVADLAQAVDLETRAGAGT